MNIELLKRLTDANGVSGNEKNIRDIMIPEFKKYTDDITVDNLGSVIAHFPGKGPKVMIAAHMDEVGFMVSHIEEHGFLRVIPIGGIDSRFVYAQKVIVHGKKDLVGIVGAIPPHLLDSFSSTRDKAISMNECFIDLGLPVEEVRELVSIGDTVTYDTYLRETGSSVFAKALDDRVGCFSLLEAIKAAGDFEADLYAVGTVQEENGMKGAKAAAHRILPDIAIALEGTYATDVPGLFGNSKFPQTHQTKGPEIRMTDGSMISDRQLISFIHEIGLENDIPHQLAVKTAGGTDAAVMQTSGLGAKVAGISVPCRYIHAPCGNVRKVDIESTIKLVAEFIKKVHTFEL